MAEPAQHISRITQHVTRIGAQPSSGTQSVVLAIIVVSYNVRELLRACLAATYASLTLAPELDATVWVVDNASADGSAAMVAAEFPQARLVASQENLGFAGGNNLALRELGFGGGAESVEREARGGGAEEQRSGGAEERRSRGAEEQRSKGAEAHVSRITHHASRLTSHVSRPDLILLLNPDAEPVADAIGQMVRFLLAHPEAGGAGAQLRYPDGRFQHGAFRFPGLRQLWFDLFPPRPRRLLDSRLNGRYARAAYDGGHPFPIDFALGAALMVRGAAIAAAGLLDEGYFMYAEEVDWCWRIRRTGWPFYCVPSAVVIHHGGASARQFRSQSFLNLWRSRRRLYDRFYGPTRRWLAGRIVRLGMWAELRRARVSAGRGEITPSDLAERTVAVQSVSELFAS